MVVAVQKFSVHGCQCEVSVYLAREAVLPLCKVRQSQAVAGSRARLSVPVVPGAARSDCWAMDGAVGLRSRPPAGIDVNSKEKVAACLRT